MIAIIDYGVGNLFSLRSSLESLSAEVVVSGDEQVISAADELILPGVGAFEDAARKLKDTGLDTLIKGQAAKKKPILGICLGMQLLFERSFEYGEHEGLGLIKGNIRPISDRIPQNLKIPHIGWNSLDVKRRDGLFAGLPEEPYVYFVHSYYLQAEEDIVTATAEYGTTIHAAVQKGNLMACQFHPEKSGRTGLAILENFAAMLEKKGE